MATESNQLKNNNYQLRDEGTAPVLKRRDGTIVVEQTQEKSTADVGLSNKLGQLSIKTQ